MNNYRNQIGNWGKQLFKIPETPSYFYSTLQYADKYRCAEFALGSHRHSSNKYEPWIVKNITILFHNESILGQIKPHG